MADRSLVLCEPLCFLMNRYGKTQLKLLKSITSDFYDADAISGAKRLLMDDIGRLCLEDFVPHVPRRRSGDGELRVIREIDDIIAMLTGLDENKSLNKLPLYVAASPDSMPSVRLFDGDMKSVLVWLEKMEGRLDNFSDLMSTIMTHFQSMQSTQSVKVRSTDHQRVIPNDAGMTVTTGNSSTPIYSGDPLQSANGGINTSTPARQQRQQKQSTTTATDTDERESESTGGPFTVPNSRRKSTKRRRTRSQLSNNQVNQDSNGQSALKNPSYAATVADNTKSNRSNGARLIVGKQPCNASKSKDGRKFVTATTFLQKSVFCIDNVSLSVDVDDICAFVTDMGVNIVSCFETKPRRRRSDCIPTDGMPFEFDRKAFRLCIASDDQHRLLDASKWPAYVSVSEWFFKPQAGQQSQQQQQQQQPHQGTVSASASTELRQISMIHHANESDNMMITMIESTIGPNTSDNPNNININGE